MGAGTNSHFNKANEFDTGFHNNSDVWRRATSLYIQDGQFVFLNITHNDGYENFLPVIISANIT